MKKIPGRDYPFVFIVPIALVTIPCWVIGTIYAFAVMGLSAGARGVYADMFRKERAAAQQEAEKLHKEEMEEMQEHITTALKKVPGINEKQIIVHTDGGVELKDKED